MRIALIVGGVLLAAILVVVIIGWNLPVAHVAARQAALAAPPDSVFALISRPAEFPSWRGGVKTVDLIQENGVSRFREHGPDGALLFEVVESVPPRRLVTKLADPSLPFGGRWIYEISPTPSGSELQITEEGEVYNPVFRFVSRYVMGHTRTIDNYLADLAREVERRRATGRI